VMEVPETVWERLRGYSWPGNVRELRNVLERSVLLAETGVLPVRWLQLPRDGGAAPEVLVQEEGRGIYLPLDGSQTLDEMEARIIQTALERNRFNVTATARALGATRQTLRYRIEKHGIEMEGHGGPRSS